MPEDQTTPNTNQPTSPPEVSQAPVATPTLTPAEPTPVTPPSTAVASTPGGNKKKLSILALAAIILLVLVGSSAGAYYGVIAPKKPENILKAAIRNTAEQKKMKFSGKILYENTEKDAELKAVNVSIRGEADSENRSFQVVTEATASGIKIPFEIRGVSKGLYVKIGDISSLTGIASIASPEFAPLVGEVNKKIADKWIEIDETLLKQANLGCTLDTDYSLTKADIDLLIKHYQTVPFAQVKNTNDTVDGQAAIKYDIEIDDNKGAEYLKIVDQLSITKKIKECNKDTSQNTDTKSLADNDKTPLTLWVNKSSKQIVKIASHSTAQDEQKEHFKASFEVTMQYGQANISKPEGAVPLMQIIGELGTVLQGSPLGQTLGISTDQ